MAHALRGAVAGAVATAVMSVHMLWMRRKGRVDAVSPEHITDAAFETASLDPSSEQHVVATTAAHLAFGSAAGAVYAAAAGRRELPWWAGTTYGLVVATASYQGWVPALGVLPPLSDASPARRNEIIVSHLIYGTVLAALVKRPMIARRASLDLGEEVTT